MTTAWQKTTPAGPLQGKAISPDVAARMINRTENPLIVVGAEMADYSRNVVDKILELADKGMPVIATAHAQKYFAGKKNVTLMGLVEITNLLRDPEWNGMNGKQHDFVIFLGIRYGLLSQMLATLKNFTDITTMNISRYFQPNASFSFPNITEDIWLEYLDELIKKMQ